MSVHTRQLVLATSPKSFCVNHPFPGQKRLVEGYELSGSGDKSRKIISGLNSSTKFTKTAKIHRAVKNAE